MGQGVGGFNGWGCFCSGVQGFDSRHALGLAAFGPTMFLGIWVSIRFFGDGGLGFRPYGESPFPNAEKVTEKALLLRAARSLGLGVPSLRDRSGGQRLRFASLHLLSLCLAAPNGRCAPTPGSIPPLSLPTSSVDQIKSSSRACAHPGVVRLRRGGAAIFGFAFAFVGAAEGCDLLILILWELACQRWRPDSAQSPSAVLNPTVGASLLAKAVGQALWTLNVLTPSRASSAAAWVSCLWEE